MAYDMSSWKQNAFGFRSRKVKWEFRVAPINHRIYCIAGNCRWCARASKVDCHSGFSWEKNGVGIHLWAHGLWSWGWRRHREKGNLRSGWAMLCLCSRKVQWCVHHCPWAQEIGVPSSQLLGSTCATGLLVSHTYLFDRTPRRFYR